MDLLNLLARSALPGLMQDDQEPVDPNEEILVQGRKPRDVFRVGATPRIVRDGMREPQNVDNGFELGYGRRSPLGVGGRLRDILGGLGDALLVGAGGEASYAPKRQEEKMQDAMSIYDQDPEQGLAAIRSLDSKRAYDIAQNELANRQEQAKLQRQAYDTEIRKISDGLKGWQTIGQTANGITDERSYQLMKPMLEKIVADYDLPLTLPDTFDKAVIDSLIKSQLGEWREQRLSQMERNLQGQQARRQAQSREGAARVQQGQQRIGLQSRAVQVQEAREARQAAADAAKAAQPRPAFKAGDVRRGPDGRNYRRDAKGNWTPVT